MLISKLTNEAQPLVPDIAGNLELPPEEQFRVWVKPLSGRQKMAVQREQASKRKNSGAMALGIIKEIITSCVDRVENLHLEDTDGTRKAVETGHQLWDAIQEGGAMWISVADQVVDFAEQGASLDDDTAKN